ncbi:MAG: acyl-CoA thioesterase, partial [Rhodoplanes sp.]
MATSSFESDKLIRFHHCDPAGNIVYPQYFIHFHELVEDWFTKGLDVSVVDQVMRDRVGIPMARVECDFLV